MPPISLTAASPEHTHFSCLYFPTLNPLNLTLHAVLEGHNMHQYSLYKLSMTVVDFKERLSKAKSFEQLTSGLSKITPQMDLQDIFKEDPIAEGNSPPIFCHILMAEVTCVYHYNLRLFV